MTKIDFEMITEQYGKIYEEEIYQKVKKHSRWIDRINPRKMYMMTAWMRDAYNIKDEDTKAQLFDDNWKFFGKKSGGIDRFI